jgi:general secretion pathway protein I
MKSRLTIVTFYPSQPRSHARTGQWSHPTVQRSGLSLLEVILALAILAMSVALLSQITKQSTDNGLMAQRLATAQMLCESKMSEVLAGAIPLTATPWTPITDSLRNGNWNYQIQTVTAQQKDMVGVRLSVTDQPDTTTENPELFFIVRWMIDPNLGLDTLPQSTDTGGSSTSSTGSGAAGGIQ